MTLETEAEAWRKSPLAPAPGTVLGPLADIPDGDAREFRFGEGRRVFSMLVVRRGGEARAYVNACPHVWLPLTYRGGQRRQRRRRAAGLLEPPRRVCGGGRPPDQRPGRARLPAHPGAGHRRCGRDAARRERDTSTAVTGGVHCRGRRGLYTATFQIHGETDGDHGVNARP